MTASSQKTFSIDPVKHRKALEVLRKWADGKVNMSHKICQAIERLDAEEDKGCKLEEYIEPYQLLKLPMINQELKDEDIDVIAESMSYGDFTRTCIIMEINLRKMLEAKRSPAIHYKSHDK